MEKKRTALLITYYWPPSGGAGVHRWLRFSSFFKENNWDLHVYCPENGAWPTMDPNLQKDVSKELVVVRRPIFEPHKFLGKNNNPNKGAGLTQKSKSSLIQRFIIWVRGNLFIPDARVFWIRPSIKFLNSYLDQHPEIDTIISTGPPHSMHLIAKGIKKKHTIYWVADFRDPWTEIDFYNDLLPGKWADNRHKKLEKEVLQQADLVVTISDSCATGLEKIGGRKVEVITNGYTFPIFDATQEDLDKKFTISHFGSMPFARNPEILWKALSNLISEHKDFADALEIKLIGSVDYKILESAHSYGLTSFLNHIQAVSHSESILMQRQTQLLLLVANNTGNVKGILTGKFFEYLGAKRPIIAIGQAESDLEKAMNSTESGVFCDYAESKKIEDFLLHSFSAFKSGTLFLEAKNLAQYSSRQLAKSLLKLIP